MADRRGSTRSGLQVLIERADAAPMGGRRGSRVLAGALRRVGWPQNLSQRVRWSVAAFAVAAPLSNLVTGVPGARGPGWGAVTAVCCLVLVATWIDVYRNGGMRWWTEPVETVSIFLLALATTSPFTALGLVYAGLNHGSLYRSTARTLVRFVLFTGAFFTALTLSPAAVGVFAPDSPVVVAQMPGLLFVAILGRLLAATTTALRRRAEQDPLTDLASREVFAEAVETERVRLRPGGQLAVLFVDVDDFKRVNDVQGHTAGDELLVQLAGRLRATVREGDLAARLGGDEFAVLLADVGAVEEVQRLADRVVSALADPFSLRGEQTGVSVSVGIALGDRGVSTADLLRYADIAMYDAKAAGKDRSALFDPERHAETLARVQLEGELVDAVADGCFRLHYQPLVTLPERRAVAVEALVRWDHPRRGLLGPADFVPLAERTGTIRTLGAWVLRRACADLTVLRADPRWPDLAVSVNVSARQLTEPGFSELVLDTLAEHRLPPSALMLEVTESVLVDDPASVAGLSRLAERGVDVAVDDFGTGYASLASLQRLPITTLKVDRSFIARIDPATSQLARASLLVGSTLGLRTVVEGVETEAQAAAVGDAGAGLAQGWLFGRPVPVTELPDLLAASRGAEVAAPRAPDGPATALPDPDRGAATVPGR